MKALLVDGEELLRLSLKEVAMVAAQPSHILIASSEREFLTLTANEDSFGLIIVHPSTLAGDGKDCLRLARRLYPSAALVIIDDATSAQSAMPSPGSVQHVARGASVASMIAAIRRALGMPNDQFMQRPISLGRPDVNGAMRTTAKPSVQDDDHIDLSRLSFRQKQILAMAADGLPNKEIAARLDIAEGTVKAHMHAIFKVMGVSNRTQAVIRFGAVGDQRAHMLSQVGA